MGCNTHDKKAYGIFLDFMTRVTKFEELAKIGGQFLSTYKSELELFRRPPLQMKTTVIRDIIEANKSEWMASYIEAGCRHHDTDVQNINKLNSCQRGIHEHMAKVKTLLEELGCLTEEVLALFNEETERLSHYMDKCCDVGLVDPLISAEESESVNQDHQRADVSECATMMQTVYSMLEVDYVMQEKIVSSLNLATPSAELESYCLMWDLRPFVDDDIISAAWKHVT